MNRPDKFNRAALFQISERGEGVRRRLERIFEGSSVELYQPGKIRSIGVKQAVKKEFFRADAIVFISAAGIAVRAIAPFIRAKDVDPAVIVADEGGRFSISLLSGHLGGANRLAERIASAVGATPVVTTATDGAGLPCLEDVSKRFNLRIEDTKKIKLVNSAILGSGRVAIVDGDKKRLSAIKRAFARFKVFRFSRRLVLRPRDRGIVFITSASSPDIPKSARGKTAFLRPKEVVAGVGCMRGASEEEIKEAVFKAFKKAGLSVLSLKRLATVDAKRGEAGIDSFAEKMGLEIDYFTGAELNKITPPSGNSRGALTATGARAVAEPSAFLSTGARRLCLKKMKTKRVTAALAKEGYQ